MDQSRKWNNLSAGFNSFEIFQNQKIHKSIFHFVFPDLFFFWQSVDIAGSRQQLGQTGPGCLDNYEADTRTMSDESDAYKLWHHIRTIIRLKLWGIAIKGNAWYRGSVYYFECVKSAGGCSFLYWRATQGFCFIWSIWNYTILQ